MFRHDSSTFNRIGQAIELAAVSLCVGKLLEQVFVLEETAIADRRRKAFVKGCKEGKLAGTCNQEQGNIIVVLGVKAFFWNHHPILVEMREDQHSDGCIAHEWGQAVSG